jgi:phosphoribosylamine--glycine ligase
MDLVIWPTVRGMADEGNVYTGFLYAGLMIDKAGNPKVIEFNCRFGDPETQPVMLRLQSSLVLLVEAALAQALDKVEAQWDPRPSLGVVLAAGGYPGDYAKGAVITGLEAAASLEGKVFHAGTALVDGQVVTAGGRVLCATALGRSVADAQAQAYELADKIDWAGCFYRDDIGYRAIARERGEDSL